jgi:glycosyltransferase involved in cell wall biosynthesis
MIFGDAFDKNFARRKFHMDHDLQTAHEAEVKQVFDAIGSKNGRIIIYPSAIHWKPLQRPQQLLKELGKNGDICFFCEEDGSSQFILEERFPNVYCVNKEVVLIEAFREYAVVIYITWAAQALMAQYFANKYIWYDIVDSLETFSFGKTRGYRQMHQSLLDLAHLVTYSAHSLNPKLSKSLYIPNGVDLSAFPERSRRTLPNASIIYVGAIDMRWFDIETLKYTARQLPKEKIYLIGRLPDSVKKLPENIISLGFIDYDELSHYLAHAKVGVIPFKKNGITETVLPCKLFEYSAMGLPTVSTGLPEVAALKKSFILNVDSRETFLAEVKRALESTFDSKRLRSFAAEYSWSHFAMQIDERISTTVLGLATLAHIDYKDTINIPSYTFFDSEGGNFFSGGAERYLIDLHELALKMGFKLRVIQKGSFNWVRYYDNLEVVGISSNEHKVPDDNVFTQKVTALTEGRSLLNIYSPFSLIYPRKFSPSIGISHGVFWDNPFDQGKLEEYLLESASLVDTMISVDTNTPNWYQTRDYQLGSRIGYIPNYVDLKEFSVQKRKFGESGKIVIVYPRRLYEPRGLYIVLDILDEVLTKYSNVEFHFVGKGNTQDVNKVRKAIKKWGNRVKWYSKSPDKMFEVYQIADIVLVPTLYSEGTSLSCLEALSSGNVVIATRIGGLVNLIFDGFNGYLIEPNADSLKQKIEEVLNSPKTVASVKIQARRTAESFNKEIWNARWKKLIESKVKARSSMQSNPEALITKRVTLEFKNSKEVVQNAKKIATYLKSGKTVFVKTKKADLDPSNSYGRLQLIR